MYQSVVHDIRDYLGGSTSSPDSVINTPFDPNRIYVGVMREFNEVPASANGVQVVLREGSAQANPKWVRDSWTVSIQVIGADRSKYMECEQLIGEITHSLIGVPTRYIGDRAFVQFSSNQLPQFVGYFSNSKPIFSSTISFVVEGLSDEYNRKALC